MRRRRGILLSMALLSLVLTAGLTLLAAEPPPVPPPPGNLQGQPPPPVIVGGQIVGGKAVLRVAAGPGMAPQGLGGAAGTDNDFTDAITLPTDRAAKKAIEAAEDCIKDEDWGNAAKLLQQLLEGKEDVFLQVRRQDLNGQETVHWSSVRAEANRLIGTMPAKGLEFYELQYGAKAKALLAEAKKKSDPQILAQVAQYYLHTEAGAEAIDLLGTYHLDRGRSLMAALCFERLLGQEKARAVAPLTLFKATLAFRRAGDSARAEQTWRQFTAKVGRDGLRLGDQTVSVRQLRDVLDSRYQPPEELSEHEWDLFRGNVSRTGLGKGSQPFLLERQWQKPTIPEKPGSETRKWIEEALTRSDGRLPASFPIATHGQVIYRTYQGIEAIDVKTGELVWNSRSDISLDALVGHEDMNGEKRKHVRDWFDKYRTGGNLNILFENSTLGTLSTDGSRVYAVDDLILPPHPSLWQQFAWNGGQPYFGALQEAVNQSRLLAFDLATEGKMVWVRGDKNDASDLAGSYFLGPPLPLGGKLYVLTEKNTQLRLACLDAQKGDVVWTQTLATARDRLLMDVNRRVQAVNLSYGDGILICPTNAGAVLGVDLLSHSLLWAHSYREGGPPAPSKQNPAQPLPGGGPAPFINPARHFFANLSIPDWKVSAPVVQDGRVVFTAPDAASVHCINLRDGGLLWKEERKDDLYLAGVFGGKVLLVGKSGCRALNLADGKQLWRVETSPPSGQGVASGHFYYLPLRRGEVCKINLDQGRIEGQRQPVAGEVPGNLIFYEDKVISQTETRLSAYTHVDAKLAEADRELKKNPKDPRALLERGELRLYEGDLAGAVADLREALANHPPTEVTAKTRTRLYETLSELLNRDWNAGEKYLDEYRELANVSIPADATTEERGKLEAEKQRREERYLSLVAKGREQQGRLVEAFTAYLDYGALAGAKDLVNVVDDPSVKSRADLWVQGRIAALLARATPEQRKQLETEIAQRWRSIQDTKDLDALRRFVATFGSLFLVGREARLELAERLADENAGLEAELHLLQLRDLPDEPRIAAQAVEALARLMTRKGLLEDAVYYYRLLNRDYPNVVLRDGRTGTDCFAELATDKRFLLYLDEPEGLLPSGSLKATEIQSRSLTMPRLIPLDLRGEMLPFFQHHRLTLVQNGGAANPVQLALLDRDTGEERWAHMVASGNTGFPMHNLFALRSPCLLKGHLAVFQLGAMIYGFDLLDRKKLWEYNLLGPDTLTPGVQHIDVDGEGNLILVDTQRSTTQRIGQLGPLTASYACLKTREGLLALDPVRGTVLWTKNDVPSHVQIFGDDQLVYLVDVRDGRGASGARALRGQDGAAVDVVDFAPAFAHRQRVLGARILAADPDTATGKLTLRLYDVRKGQDLWKQTFAPKSIVLKADDGDLAGVVEPGGKLTVVDLVAHKEVVRAEVKPEHLDKVTDGLLLHDAANFYVVLNRPAGANINQQGPWPNVIGLRNEPVNGMVYAFARDTGELRWRTTEPVQNQRLLLEQFQELPMLLFTSNYMELPNPNRVNAMMPATHTQSIDKRTGKLVWMKTSAPNQVQFHTLKINRPAGVYDLVGSTLTLRHYFEGAGATANSAATPRP